MTERKESRSRGLGKGRGDFIDYDKAKGWGIGGGCFLNPYPLIRVAYFYPPKRDARIKSFEVDVFKIFFFIIITG